MEMTFGEKIKLLREEKELTQSELGSMVNMTQRKVSYLENGKYEPSLEDIKALCKCFHVLLCVIIHNERVEGLHFKRTRQTTCIQPGFRFSGKAASAFPDRTGVRVYFYPSGILALVALIRRQGMNILTVRRHDRFHQTAHFHFRTPFLCPGLPMSAHKRANPSPFAPASVPNLSFGSSQRNAPR